MLQALLLGTFLGAAPAPVQVPGAEAVDAATIAPAIVHTEAVSDPAAVMPVRLEEARPMLAPPPNPSEEGAEQVRQRDAGRFIYNVAVGVAVTVLSALILRAIL
jgi:hypothetical protein